MSCLNPTQAWQDLFFRGSKLIWRLKELDSADYFFNSKGEFVSARYRALTIPCGKCILCRHSRAWEITVRSFMEFKALENPCGCFVTLTVDDEHMHEVFPGRQLRHKPFQDFMKRIRRKCEREIYGFGKDVSRQYRKSLRYLMCGEYGEHSHRPHFHVCFFGVDFTERSDFLVNRPNVDPLGPSSRTQPGYYSDCRPGRWYNDGSRCDSPFVAECWPFGHIQCRPLNDKALAYVAGYQLKQDIAVKDVDKLSYVEWWQKILDEQDRFYDSKSGSYVKWSRMPGLGYRYMLQHPSLFRLQHERCDDGFQVPTICPSLVINGRQVFFDGRYFKTKLALTDKSKYDTMMSLSEGRVFLKAIHNNDMLAKVRASNLKNRAAQIELKLAGKSRDISSHNR